MIQEVMTAGQLAQYLQLDEQTVYRKAKRGQIPSVRIGKTLRFKRDVIDSWLKLSSLRWTPEKRESLRTWAENFAKSKKLKPSDVQEIVNQVRNG